MLCLRVAPVASKVFSAAKPLMRSFGIYEKPTPPWEKKRPTEHRPHSPCSLCPYEYPDIRPCFDLSTVLVERGGPCHEKLIRSFLYNHYWPREPSIVSTYMPLSSPYLSVLTEKYCTSGDRWLAFEIQPRTKERRPIGFLWADKTFPWVADEYEEWAHNSYLQPERHNMYFRAHCLRNPNVFDRYHVPYAYDIEVLATMGEVTGHGVALLLMRSAILRALELRHPLIQILSKSQYTHAVCERAGLKQDWEMDYSEFIDEAGRSVFYPRRPHKKVRLYVHKFDQKVSTVPEACFYPDLYQVYLKQIGRKTITPHPGAEKEFRLFPKCTTSTTS